MAIGISMFIGLMIAPIAIGIKQMLRLQVNLLQLLRDFQNRGTDQRVFLRNIQHLEYFLPVGMRVFAAGGGSAVVNGTVIFPVEERAGRMVHHEITVFIHVQVLLQKIAGLHAHMCGSAFNVFLVKNRAGGFTAVRTLQAVDMLKGFFVELMRMLVEVFRFGALQLRDKFFIAYAVFLGALVEGLDIHHAKIAMIRTMKTRFADSAHSPTLLP
ncbi:MAG: hypothetical protein FD123_1378 [Bacteroidetes bacterium]|nr:MAG: hypothetical protein FD123_1378 [Bacteroidota bacterium]